jgi:putative ABC transport system permease protein
MNTLLQDLRYGMRMLIKHPFFTLVAMLALALGIGANTAIFNVVNAVLLRPLPFEKPEQLVSVYEKRVKLNRLRNVVSSPDFIDWENQNHVFENLAAYTGDNFNLTGADEPVRIVGTTASGKFFKVLGVKPLLGRTFTDEEDKAGAPHVVVLSHAFWQRRFGSDAGIIGKPLTFNGESYTVIGVMPQRFDFPDRKSEMWTPLALDTSQPLNRGSHYLNVVGRLKEGVALAQAQAEMETIAARLEQQYPDKNTGHSVNIFPLYEEVVGQVRPALWVLMGAVGFVLLIACANVANLSLARSATRNKELAIRTALGASRLRVVRQLLTESLLLAGLGGVCGLLLALWGTEALVAIIPVETPRVNEIGMDWRVLGFAFGISLLTGLIFGLLPALQASKPDLNESLKESSRGAAGSFHGSRARSLLIVSEVALSLVLLIGAGLMLKSFVRLREINPGFNPENVLAMEISLSPAKYKEVEKQVLFFGQIIERARALPGVQAAGATAGLPLGGQYAARYFGIEGRPPQPAGEGFNANYNIVSSNYFRTLGIPLLRGRDIDDRDVQSSTHVVVVNEALARRYFPNEDALGQHIAIGDATASEIVGVVGDVHNTSLEAETKPEMYFPYTQDPIPFMTLTMRSTADTQSLAAAMQREVRAIDRDQPIYNIRMMNEVLAESVSSRRVTMLLLGLFASLSLLLAMVGIYGVISYTVTQRTKEIGIRLALGARASDVMRLIVGQGMLPVLIGVGIGLAAAFALTRVMSSLLFSVSATDPLTFIGVSLLLALVALVACLIPARRATKVDPMVALRYE